MLQNQTELSTVLNICIFMLGLLMSLANWVIRWITVLSYLWKLLLEIWWNEGIESLTVKCSKAARIFTRCLTVHEMWCILSSRCRCDIFRRFWLGDIWFTLYSINIWSQSVASPGFAARRGKTGHGLTRRTSGPGAAAAWCLVVLWLMQYWLKELWVVDICTSDSRRLHNTWIVGCQIYSKVN